MRIMQKWSDIVRELLKRVNAGLRRHRDPEHSKAAQKIPNETEFPMGILWVYPFDSAEIGSLSMAEVDPYYGNPKARWTQMEIFLSDWLLMSFGLNWRLAKVVALVSPQDLPKRKQPELGVRVQNGICRLAKGSAFEEFNGIINVDLGDVYYDEALGIVWAGEVTGRAFQILPNVRIYVDPGDKLTAVSMLIQENSDPEQREAWEIVEQEFESFPSSGLEFVILPLEFDGRVSFANSHGDEYLMRVWSVNSFTVSLGNILVFSFDQHGILNGALVNVFGVRHLVQAKALSLPPKGPLQCLVVSTRNPAVGSNVLLDVGETFYDADAELIWTGGFTHEGAHWVSENVSISLDSEGSVIGFLISGFTPAT